MGSMYSILVVVFEQVYWVEQWNKKIALKKSVRALLANVYIALFINYIKIIISLLQKPR